MAGIMRASLKDRPYWEYLAATYELLGHPLRPSEEDVRIFDLALLRWLEAHPVTGLRAILLGATPALTTMRWPAHTTLIGCDASVPMMLSVWPCDRGRTVFGICGNWMDLPLAPSSLQIAVGDGALNCLPNRGAAIDVCRSVRGALADDGLFLARCYIRPEQPETPGQVFEEMFRGAIPSFGEFKFRLLLAMPQDTRSSLAVEAVYRLWASHSINLVGLAAVTGWPLSQIETIEGYRNSSTVYYLPQLDEMRSVLDEQFDEISMATPSYPLGRCCPVFAFRARPGIRS